LCKRSHICFANAFSFSLHRLYYSTLITLLGVWFVSSVVQTLSNKSIIDVFPYASTLSLFHLSSGAAVDFILLRIEGTPAHFTTAVRKPAFVMHV
jgi:hypothetical protein